MAVEIVLVTKESQTYSYLKNLLDTGGYTVYDLACKNYFKNLLPYPSKSEFKDLVKECECCGKAEVLVSAEQQRKESRDTYHEEDARLTKMFRLLLLYEHKVTGEKAQKIFELAWSDGHASGLSDVAHYFEKYCEFIKDIESIPKEN
jgi:hypothetical protein